MSKLPQTCMLYSTLEMVGNACMLIKHTCSINVERG